MIDVRQAFRIGSALVIVLQRGLHVVGGDQLKHGTAHDQDILMIVGQGVAIKVGDMRQVFAPNVQRIRPTVIAGCDGHEAGAALIPSAGFDQEFAIVTSGGNDRLIER